MPQEINQKEVDVLLSSKLLFPCDHFLRDLGHPLPLPY
jgi:hypothetical protein